MTVHVRFVRHVLDRVTGHFAGFVRSNGIRCYNKPTRASTVRLNRLARQARREDVTPDSLNDVGWNWAVS